MGSCVFPVAFYLWVSTLPFIHGQLSTADKQSLLDLHNELRGAAGGANILQSVSRPPREERAYRIYLCIPPSGMEYGAGANSSSLLRGLSLRSQPLRDDDGRDPSRGEPGLHAAGQRFSRRGSSGGYARVGGGPRRLEIRSGTVWFAGSVNAVQ